MKIGIIGGGAAGFFAAITTAETSKASITILEKSPNVLSKVRISGGGRCNVTNAVSDIKEFIKYYPRGSKELISTFSRFSNLDTIEWFRKRGVYLKTETDGRVFPVSDNSQTIIDLFTSLASKCNINVITGFDAAKVSFSNGLFTVKDRRENTLSFNKLLVSAGGFSTLDKYNWLINLGHNIITPVPSLFTFNCKDTLLSGLQGIAVEDVMVKVSDTKLSSQGDILITHWGLSGPSILKLSAFGARVLNEMNYKFTLVICWTKIDVHKETEGAQKNSPLKQIIKHPFRNIPIRLWESLIINSGVNHEKRFNELSKKDVEAINNILTHSQLSINGKSTFKEEFVTAGGVSLKEVDFRTMESKIVPGLYFAGELLDIDGVTGGFNFQSAWSTAYIAGQSMANQV
ncbi:MAG: NAD(P)/FAD-dependent oxidoreductase [Candidatus Kapaibacterium sp.]